VTLLFYYILGVRLRREHFLRVTAVGYSAVIFGWCAHRCVSAYACAWYSRSCHRDMQVTLLVLCVHNTMMAPVCPHRLSPAHQVWWRLLSHTLLRGWWPTWCLAGKNATGVAAARPRHNHESTTLHLPYPNRNSRACSGDRRMTVLAVRGKGAFSVLGVAEMPMWASPFVSLALTSAVVPRASFLGHLAGIAAGFAVRRRPRFSEC